MVSEKPSDDSLASQQQVLDPVRLKLLLWRSRESATLIIDERRGRNIAVLQRKIKIIGTGAVLLVAKNRRHIENIREPIISFV